MSLRRALPLLLVLAGAASVAQAQESAGGDAVVPLEEPQSGGSDAATGDPAAEPPVELGVAYLAEGAEDLDLRAFDARARLALEAEGFSRTLTPPVSWSDLALAAGCGAGMSRVCLDRVAQALGASAIVLRRAHGDASSLSLELVYRDPSSADAPTRVRQLASTAVLTDEAPALVHALFGGAPPVAVAQGIGLGLAPWITLVAGGVVLAGGALLGASASWGAHETLYAHTHEDVDRIQLSLADAQARAIAGDVLIGIGVTAIAVGIVLLAIDFIRSHASTRSEARVERQ